MAAIGDIVSSYLLDCKGRIVKELDFAISKRALALRTHLKLTQDEVADKTGLTKYKVSDVERQRLKPDAEYLLAMVTGLGVSPEWLVMGTGEMLAKVANGGDSLEKVLEAAQIASLEAQSLNEPPEVQRAAQEWLIAIRTRNSQALRELAMRSAAGLQGGQWQVQEATPVYDAGRPAKLNQLRLASAIEAVEGAMGLEGSSLQPVKKAGLIAAVYALNEGADVPLDVVRQLVRVAS